MSIIGKTILGIRVYSNPKRSAQQANLYRGVFTGLKYECVEFARRFWVITRQYTFPEIESAVDLWSLTHFQSVIPERPDLAMQHFYPTTSNVPILGDLVIFDRSPTAPHGHVSVVIKCRQYKKHVYVYICDQNFNDQSFNKTYNGRIKLTSHKASSDRGEVIGIVRGEKK
jgi:hypothetical protein